jgi:hypothetical protein
MILSEGEWESFTIPSFKDKLESLKEKTKDIVYPNELEKDVGWSYGAPTWAVKPLVNEWINEYDWEEARDEMAQWHHYRMQVQGLAVHYVHEPSPHPDAIPIILLHGWPSTFYEFHKLIVPLRDGLRGNQVKQKKKSI